MADDPKINEELDSLRENVANLHTKMDHLNRILSESFITLKIIEQHDGKIDQCIRLLNKLTNKVDKLEKNGETNSNSTNSDNHNSNKNYGRPEMDLTPIKLVIPKTKKKIQPSVPFKPKLSLQDMLIGELKKKLKDRPKIE
jgi:hypothetical protein